MRPHLAIITDSFREAIASRVLLLLLVLATLFLLAIVPISLRESTGEASAPVAIPMLHVGYPLFASESALPMVTKDDFLDAMLREFTDIVLGVIGIMVALLVTASSIPKTYEAGSVDLLLSKPLSRSGVFLANFVGGCAFILLIATYVIVGLWLIAGVRHGYWNQRFLLCIPLLLFLFAIYYSVSALAGVIWKNAVVSVFIAVAFWCLCFGSRAVKWLFEHGVMNPSRVVEIVATDDTIITSVPFGFGADTFVWNQVGNNWTPAFVASDEARHLRFMSGPVKQTPLVYDPYAKQLLQLTAVSVSPTDGRISRGIVAGRREDGWQQTVWGIVPDDMTDLLVTSKGRYLVAGPSGLFVAKPKTDEPPDDQRDDTSEEPELSPSASSIGPDDWPAFQSIAIDRRDDSLVVVTAQQLIRYNVNDEGRYVRGGSGSLKSAQPRRIAICGSSIAVAAAGGKIELYDAQSLERQSEFAPHGENEVTQLVSSSDGRWLAALYNHQQLWLCDAQQQQPIAADVWRQGDVSAISFMPDNRLAVATAYNHVRAYRLDPLTADTRFDPTLTTPETIYWYVVTPIYTVLPKPGELGDMVTYLVTGKRTLQSPPDGDVRPAEKLNIWQPVWTNLVFLAVVLGVACFYVERKDF